MDQNTILDIIEYRQTALSAKGIIYERGMDADADSQMLQAVEHECWQLVDQGKLIAYDRRDISQGLFFAIKQN